MSCAPGSGEGAHLGALRRAAKFEHVSEVPKHREAFATLARARSRGGGGAQGLGGGGGGGTCEIFFAKTKKSWRSLLTS